MYAVETVNAAFFLDIGGLSAVDLNFEINHDKHFPLYIASVKGRYFFCLNLTVLTLSNLCWKINLLILTKQMYTG